MNTIDLTHRLHLVTGLQFRGYECEDTLTYNKSTGAVSFPGGGSYFDVLPSASLRIGLTNDSGLRLVYGRGLSRPNPSDLAQQASVPVLTVNPHTISLGNPDLKPEHANNYDILYEQYLKPLGMIQAGLFYKQLSDPIIASPGIPTTGTYAGYLVSQPLNAGSAHVAGLEAAYQQHLSL